MPISCNRLKSASMNWRVRGRSVLPTCNRVGRNCKKTSVNFCNVVDSKLDAAKLIITQCETAVSEVGAGLTRAAQHQEELDNSLADGQHRMTQLESRIESQRAATDKQIGLLKGWNVVLTVLLVWAVWSLVTG